MENLMGYNSRESLVRAEYYYFLENRNFSKAGEKLLRPSEKEDIISAAEIKKVGDEMAKSISDVIYQ